MTATEKGRIINDIRDLAKSLEETLKDLATLTMRAHVQERRLKDLEELVVKHDE